MKRGPKLAILAVALAGLGVGWFAMSLSPMPTGPEKTFRFTRKVSIEGATRYLQGKGVLRSAGATTAWLRLKRQTQPIAEGTYRVRPGMSVDELARALRRPIRQNVRLPEGWWIARTAKRLEEHGVCTAQEYIELAHQPERFQGIVDFPLPKDSLEGYLFPDTYDLPPLLGAEAVIQRQLQAFENKVLPHVTDPAKLPRAVNIASMVELEAALDRERPIIAGVIENRLRRGMRLQIDATVLYALQEWKQLGPGVVNTVKSPYNTYRIDGLPPGPIGSPGLASIRAALDPARHAYLFYVARPDRSHYFTGAYADHIQAIRRARAEHRKARQAKP